MPQPTLYDPPFIRRAALRHIPASAFPTVNPVRWRTTRFAVGVWSPPQRLSGMLTAHMSRIAPRSGFTWRPHRGLKIYTRMLEGMPYHEDGTGGKSEIGQHDLQRMFSGDHIEHQEPNPHDKPARVIQIWFMAGFYFRDVADPGRVIALSRRSYELAPAQKGLTAQPPFVPQ